MRQGTVNSSDFVVRERVGDLEYRVVGLEVVILSKCSLEVGPLIRARCSVGLPYRTGIGVSFKAGGTLHAWIEILEYDTITFDEFVA